jgi:hypothetical protein
MPSGMGMPDYADVHDFAVRLEQGAYRVLGCTESKVRNENPYSRDYQSPLGPRYSCP